MIQFAAKFLSILKSPIEERMTLKHSIFLLFAATASFKAVSAPWIEVDNIGLRADIQLLADTGVINLPVSTYPLMWESVAQSIKNIDLQQLSPTQQTAFIRLKKNLTEQTSSVGKAKIDASLTTGDTRFSSFGTRLSEKQRIGLGYEQMNSDWAGRINLNYANPDDPNIDSNSLNFDGSYLAYKLGNWVISAASIEQWWGPGIDTSLIMSNNSRPLPAIAIRRNDSAAFKSPWLSWIGPWTFSAQMAQLENDRFVPDTKMWSSRAAFKPYRKIEFGVSWSYQWAGQGQPSSLDHFFRGLTGDTECINGASSCDEALQTKLGNQIAGFDLRWSDSIKGIPYSIYTQRIGEDSPEPGTIKISDRSYLYGIETQFTFDQFHILTNLEYTDTQANCGARGDTSQDCFYEHGTYRTGYRYYQRSIGSTYDNDAETIVLTLFAQHLNSDTWQIKFRNLDLNTNDRDRYPDNPQLGNSVSKIAQKVNQIEVQHEFDFYKGRLTLGGLFSDIRSQQNDDSEFELILKYSYFF